jgi:hypothetical protein
MATRILPTIFAVCIAASLGGCAASPESIPATNIPPSIYAGYSCNRLLNLQQRIEASVQTAMLRQKSASINDAWGVFLWGLPTASISGGDIAPQVASLKGQRATVSSLISAQGCITSDEGI